MASITEFLASRKPEEVKSSGRRTVAIETAKAFLAMPVSADCQKTADVIAAYLYSEGHSKNSDSSSAARHVIAMYECLAQMVNGSPVTWIDGKQYTLHVHTQTPLETALRQQNEKPPANGQAGKHGNPAASK